MTRERPYDMRWGQPDLVKAEFGIGESVLKAAWKAGWIKARQPTWEEDGKRAMTIYCFEDIQVFIEEVMHVVNDGYAAQWWTTAEIAAYATKIQDGPYGRRQGAQETGGGKAQGRVRHGPKRRKDGFMPLGSRI